MCEMNKCVSVQLNTSLLGRDVNFGPVNSAETDGRNQGRFPALVARDFTA